MHLPNTTIVVESDPAALVTVHRYCPASVPVMDGRSKTALSETIFPRKVHSNILFGPPSALHVTVSDDPKDVKIFPFIESVSPPDGDTVENRQM